MATSPPLRGLTSAFLLLYASLGHAADPTVTNVRAAQKAGTKQVEIYYDVSGATTPVFVSLQVSADGGTNFTVPANTLTGHVGAGVSLGKNRMIIWNAGADWNDQLSNTVKIRITASDAPPITGDFALIPAGNFQMGDSFADSFDNERPVHTVYVSAFYIAKHETTKALWDEVRAWGLNNGYTDLLNGSGKGALHPVHTVNWYDIVKWCNARSQKDGLIPCYTVSGAVYKTGQNLGVSCNFAANGYRLPTEAEWEKAARGGLSGKRFPWGDTIDHSRANYQAAGIEHGNQSGNAGHHPAYNDGTIPYSSPVGSFAPNGYGLYDMAGNMWEECWDWYGTYPSTSQSDPRGPDTGAYRVFRGGSWIYWAQLCSVAFRGGSDPSFTEYDIGFRVARSSVP